jgi:hypothetical protein
VVVEEERELSGMIMEDLVGLCKDFGMYSK